MEMKFIQGKEAVDFVKHLATFIPDETTQARIIYIDKTTLVNPIFKTKQTMHDLFFLCKDSSDRPLFIKSVTEATNETDQTEYYLHHDYNHFNMNTGAVNRSLTIDDKIYIFRCIPFCNPVMQTNLYRDPDKFSKILKGQLLEGNPNDKWRGINYIDIEGYEAPIRCSECGTLLSTKAITPIVAVSHLCPSCLAHETPDVISEYKSKLKEIKDQLADKENRFVYSRIDSSWAYRVINVKHFEPDLRRGRILSSYYKSFKDDDIKESDYEMPVLEKQALFAGLGSANSAIIDLTSRGDLIHEYTLVDYDKVEYKNLRNQVYLRGNVGSTKTDAMEHVITTRYSGEPVTKYEIKKSFGRIENFSANFTEFKYIFSGFDSFKARKALLEMIKNNKIKGKYLIDTRYEGQNCSAFFIDISNQDEMIYYENLLLADEEEFNKSVITRELNQGEKEDYIITMQQGQCASTFETLKGIIGDIENTCSYPCGVRPIGCSSPLCRAKILEVLDKVKVQATANTCVAVNQIAIYKLVGTYIYLAVKQIEQGKNKPFTYMEFSTDEMPQAMTIKR